MLRVVSDSVFETVLDKDLLLVWEGWVATSKLEEAFAASEVYREKDGYLVTLALLESEIYGLIHVFAGAGVATQIDFFANHKFLFSILRGQFDPAVQISLVVELALNSVLVSAVDDVA